MSKKKAAATFGIPRSTIRFRLSGKFTKTSCGPPPVLTVEEAALVSWIAVCGKKGFPRRKEDVILSVQSLLKKNKRTNPFPHDRPGDGWYRAFLKRNPMVADRIAVPVTRASTCVSESNIRGWFESTE